jgi:hypothetical protein
MWLSLGLLMILWGFLLAEVIAGRTWGPGPLGKLTRQRSPVQFWLVIVASGVGAWLLSQLVVSASTLTLFSDLLARLPSTVAVNQPIAAATSPPEIVQVADSACPVSGTETYGFTKNDPVRIGGGDFDGPLRTSAYLQTLRGPNHEAVSYALSGFAEVPGGRVNVLVLTVAGHDAPVTLYVDHASYSALRAPMGFTCDQDFALSAP